MARCTFLAALARRLRRLFTAVETLRDVDWAPLLDVDWLVWCFEHATLVVLGIVGVQCHCVLRLVVCTIRDDAGLSVQSLSVLVRSDHGGLLGASEVLVTHMSIVISFAWTVVRALFAHDLSEISNGLALTKPRKRPHATTRCYPLIDWRCEDVLRILLRIFGEYLVSTAAVSLSNDARWAHKLCPLRDWCLFTLWVQLTLKFLFRAMNVRQLNFWVLQACLLDTLLIIYSWLARSLIRSSNKFLTQRRWSFAIDPLMPKSRSGTHRVRMGKYSTILRQRLACLLQTWRQRHFRIVNQRLPNVLVIDLVFFRDGQCLDHRCARDGCKFAELFMMIVFSGA